MIGWGLLMVCLPIKPFWVDEWRIIYNLKYKTPETIWGPLDYMQQFPRVYLAIVKAFTSAFHYSYTSLRLPSFLVGGATILFCWRLMKLLYPEAKANKYLFVMVLVSSYTFTEYFVQAKQYTMEMLLSLVALWQLIGLVRLKSQPGIHFGKYVLLCLGFVIAPFFSYTYPIVVAPVYIVVLLESILFLKEDNIMGKGKVLFLQWLPLLLCLLSIFVFYKIDIAQVMKDEGMQDFWSEYIMKDGFDAKLFVAKFFHLFAEVGSGALFEILFGVVGLGAFLYGSYRVVPALSRQKSTDEIVRLYCVLVIVVTVGLFMAGKLPLGEPRLNSFTVPAISILIIYLLDNLASSPRGKIAAGAIAIVLYAGVTGNIYTSCINTYTDPKYARKMRIYKATETAIKIAQEKQIPVLVTPGVVYPHNGTRNYPYKTKMPGDWVFKSFPAYDVSKEIPVYPIDSITDAASYISHLPPTTTEVMVGDGEAYNIVRW
jgi:hypothetical protein